MLDLAQRLQSVIPSHYPAPLEDASSFQAVQWMASRNDTAYLMESMPLLGLLQLYVAVVLYFATNGEAWTDQCDFLSVEKHVCDWNCPPKEIFDIVHGVQCVNGTDGQRWISRFAFFENNMVGTIPPELGLLSQHLEITHFGFEAGLSGILPEQLWDLENLNWLRMTSTSIGGTFSTRLGELTNLETLWIDGGLFTGSIPTQITSLPRLVTLILQFNFLEGSVPVIVSPDLEVLVLSKNLLTGALPESMANLSNLHTVGFVDNALTGTIPDNWSSDTILSEMTILGLSANLLGGKIPSNLAAHPKWKSLSLSFNDFTGSLPETWGSFGMLTSLQLGQLTKLSSTIPSGLGILFELRSLHLDGSQLRGSIPSELAKLRKLMWLWLDNNHLTGTVPASFDKLRHLDSLRLTHNELVGDLSFLCDMLFHEFEELEADCLDPEEITSCPCCTICCDGEGACGIPS